MKRALRLYEGGRGDSDNIGLVDKLMLVVNSVNEREHKIWFVVNPSVVDYRQTAVSRSVGYEAIDDTRFFWVAPKTKPVEVEVEGTLYQIALAAIGVEGERRWAYGDFVVTW